MSSQPYALPQQVRPLSEIELDLPAVRPGFYRVIWTVDLPRDEFADPREAAEEGRRLAAGDCAGCDGIVNAYTVIDGETGVVTGHDLTA